VDLLFAYTQKKQEKGSNECRCDLSLFSNGKIMRYHSYFFIHYRKCGEEKQIEFEHNLDININNGDIDVTYKIINNISLDSTLGNVIKNKKNDFKLLKDLTRDGFIKGERKPKYWGIKYEKAIDTVFNLIYETLHPKLKTEFFKNKPYKDKFVINPLYDLLVDFHLDSKNIKGHNSIYENIQYDYPKTVWLNKNDNKFLPAILDQYGIKCKYLIKELSDCDKSIQISSLNYICKLFGENYIDYLKQFDWKPHCFDIAPNKKIHQLKTDHEKKCMVQLLNKWEKNVLHADSSIFSINELFLIRERLESSGYNLKFNCRTDNEFENIREIWKGFRSHLGRGYKLRYVLPSYIVESIEESIVVDNEVYQPKILLTEDEYRQEGFLMKNCMAKQFTHGSIYIYVALQHKRKRINIQYRKGKRVQALGKTNIPIPIEFKKPLEILDQRFSKYPEIKWNRERYDLIKK
jgi:hypothetical protein